MSYAPSPRIEELRTQLLVGLMKRDSAEWRRRMSAAEREIDQSEVVSPFNAASQPHRYDCGGFDEYRLAVGRAR